MKLLIRHLVSVILFTNFLFKSLYNSILYCSLAMFDFLAFDSAANSSIANSSYEESDKDNLPFRAEYAKYPKMCDKCNELIEQDDLSLSKSSKLATFDEYNSPWFHLECFFKLTKSNSANRPVRVEQIENFENLNLADKRNIQEKIDRLNKDRSLIENVVKDDPIEPKSKLERQVQDLLTKIFQPELQTMAVYQYREANIPKPDFMLNLDNMPWGRLKHGIIMEACEVMRLVLNLLDEKDSIPPESELDELSSRFDHAIIENFGNDFKLPILENPDPLFKVKLRVLQFFLDGRFPNLGYLLLLETDTTRNRRHLPAPLDCQFINLQCHIETVDVSSDIERLITRYFTNSCGNRYSIQNIFQLERYDEEKRFAPFKNDPNRKLLWHGSLIANFVGILSTGLRMTQARGGRFGSGIYFADAAQKSIHYARGEQCNLLLLCEVALGKETGKTSNSTVHRGTCFPDPLQNETMENGTIVPCGALNMNEIRHDYNEYIVSNEARVQLKYLVQIGMNTHALTPALPPALPTLYF